MTAVGSTTAREPSAPMVCRIAGWVAAFQVLQLALALGALGLETPVGWIESDGPWLNVLVPALGIFVYLGWSAPVFLKLLVLVGAFVAFPVGAWLARSRPMRRRPRLAGAILGAAILTAAGLQLYSLVPVYDLFGIDGWPANW